MFTGVKVTLTVNGVGVQIPHLDAFLNERWRAALNAGDHKFKQYPGYFFGGEATPGVQVHMIMLDPWEQPMSQIRDFFDEVVSSVFPDTFLMQGRRGDYDMLFDRARDFLGMKDSVMQILVFESNAAVEEVEG